MTLRRIQGIFRGHVDVTVVDVAQHGLEGLLARYHLADGDVDLTVLGHEGAKHGLKVTWGAKRRELRMSEAERLKPMTRQETGTTT